MTVFDEDAFIARIRALVIAAREAEPGKSHFLTQDELDREWLLSLVDRYRPTGGGGGTVSASGFPLPPMRMGRWR